MRISIHSVLIFLFVFVNISTKCFSRSLENFDGSYFKNHDSIQIFNNTNFDISYYLVYTLSVEQIFLPKKSSIKFEPAEDDIILLEKKTQCNYFLKNGKSYYVDKIINGVSRIKSFEKNIEYDSELGFFPLCIDSFGILRPMFFLSHKNKFESLSLRDQKNDEIFVRQIGFLKQYVQRNKLSNSFFQKCEYILNIARIVKKTQVLEKSKNINELKLNINKWRSETYEYYKDSLRKFVGLINKDDVFLNVFERDLLSNIAILIQHNQFNEKYNDSHIDFFIRRHTQFKDYFDGFVRDYIVTENLISCIGAGFDIPEDMKINYINLKVGSYFSNFIDSLLTKRLIKKDFDKDIKVLLLKKSGTQVQWDDILNEYKGKYLYIDFWASWCQPCRFEMPSSKKLANQFDKNKIVFIYISIDENIKDWEKANSQIGLSDNNSFILLNASGVNAKKYFKISEIPRYLIIDKTGKIVNADAPRPSEEALVPLLNKLLEK